MPGQARPIRQLLSIVDTISDQYPTNIRQYPAQYPSFALEPSCHRNDEEELANTRIVMPARPGADRHPDRFNSVKLSSDLGSELNSYKKTRHSKLQRA